MSQPPTHQVTSILSYTITIEERTLAISELAPKLQEGLEEVTRRLSNIHGLVLEGFAKNECPTLFVISPEVSITDIVTAQVSDSDVSSGLMDWAKSLGEVRFN